MNYRTNVANLAHRRGVPLLPLLGLWEPALSIRELKFWMRQSTGFIRFSPERWNRPVRLFLEEQVVSARSQHMLTGSDEIQRLLVHAKEFFAERWEQHPHDDLTDLISHLKESDAIEIGRKK